jgi:hypothetical protein
MKKIADSMGLITVIIFHPMMKEVLNRNAGYKGNHHAFWVKTDPPLLLYRRVKIIYFLPVQMKRNKASLFSFAPKLLARVVSVDQESILIMRRGTEW